jgi:hypothetical protein
LKDETYELLKTEATRQTQSRDKSVGMSQIVEECINLCLAPKAVGKPPSVPQIGVAETKKEE